MQIKENVGKGEAEELVNTFNRDPLYFQDQMTEDAVRMVEGLNEDRERWKKRYLAVIDITSEYTDKLHNALKSMK